MLSVMSPIRRNSSASSEPFQSGRTPPRQFRLGWSAESREALYEAIAEVGTPFARFGWRHGRGAKLTGIPGKTAMQQSEHSRAGKDGPVQPFAEAVLSGLLAGQKRSSQPLLRAIDAGLHCLSAYVQRVRSVFMGHLFE